MKVSGWTYWGDPRYKPVPTAYQWIALFIAKEFIIKNNYTAEIGTVPIFDDKYVLEYKPWEKNIS